MAILYDKKSLLENKKFVETVSSIYTVAPEEAADRVEALVNEHKRSFGADAADTVLFSAPGRIEIVGNHTDHNNGKVIAAAISVDLLGAVSETKDNKIVVNSIGYPSVSVDITDLEPKEDEKGDSAALVRGIVKAFVDRGLNVGGFIATTTSDVFKGAGMSSSASFELFVAEVLNSFYNGGVVSAIDKAIISQYAENVYFGSVGRKDALAVRKRYVRIRSQLRRRPLQSDSELCRDHDGNEGYRGGIRTGKTAFRGQGRILFLYRSIKG